MDAPGTGGTEAYVEGLARFLMPDEDVVIVTLSGGASEARARFPGIPACSVEGAFALGGLLETYGRGIVVNLHLYASLLPAAVLARLARAFVVATLHMPLTAWGLRHRTTWRCAAAAADALIGVSGECLNGFGWLARRRLLVVPGALPLAEMPAPKDPIARPDGAFTVAGVGRLAREKDWPTLIRAVADCHGVRLVLIGEGPLHAMLRDLASELAVEVEFLGRLSRHDVFAQLLRADAFVLPSRFEGLGLAAIEAMALGVPTITADFPASAEYIVEGKTGLTFPRGHVARLAQQISALRDDDALRSRISSAGARASRERFTPEKQYGQYRDLFRSLGRGARSLRN